jgi:hypothetical protein
VVENSEILNKTNYKLGSKIMSHYGQDYDRIIRESTNLFELESQVSLSNAVAEALKYRTPEGLYDMKTASEIYAIQ